MLYTFQTLSNQFQNFQIHYYIDFLYNIRIKSRHSKNLYQKAKQFVKLQTLKQFKKTNTTTKGTSATAQQELEKQNLKSPRSRIRKIAESVLMDQESKLLYGFGFDSFIYNIKKQKMKDNEGQYLQTLQNILYKLGLKNDTELVQLYKYFIVNETKDSYRDQAREFILKKIIQEVKDMKQQQRNESEILDKYLDFSKSSKEYIISSFNELDNQNVAFKDKVKDALKQENIEPVAHEIALKNLEKKILVNKKIEAKRPEIDKLFSEDTEELEEDLIAENNNYQQIKQLLGSNPDKYISNQNEWEAYQIYSIMKQNYYKNKEQFNKENEKIKAQQKNQHDVDVFQFLNKSRTQQEIDNLLKKLRLSEEIEEKPEFKDILNKIDFLIDSAPISLKNKLNQDAQSNNNKFIPNFSNQQVNVQDLIWDNFLENYSKVFPQIYESQQLKEQSQQKDQLRFQSTQVPTILEYDGNIDEQENIRNYVYSEKDLKEEERVELEVYRRVKRDPFFTHYLENDLRYFSERMQDGFQDSRRGIMLSQAAGQVQNYYDPQTEQSLQLEEQDESDVEFQQTKETKELVRQIYTSSGKRKTCKCVCVIKQGTGKVQINKRKYIEYFSHPYYRNIVLKPIFIAQCACEYDIDLFIQGGGVSGQAQAASIAIARGLVQIMPNLKPLLMKFSLIKTDYRQKERKKTGKFKARKSWTYVRR